MSVAESDTRRPDSAEASVTIDGVRHEFPVLKGTLGPDVIDIGAFYHNTGHFTYGGPRCGRPSQRSHPSGRS